MNRSKQDLEHLRQENWWSCPHLRDRVVNNIIWSKLILRALTLNEFFEFYDQGTCHKAVKSSLLTNCACSLELWSSQNIEWPKVLDWNGYWGLKNSSWSPLRSFSKWIQFYLPITFDITLRREVVHNVHESSAKSRKMWVSSKLCISKAYGVCVVYCTDTGNQWMTRLPLPFIKSSWFTSPWRSCEYGQLQKDCFRTITSMSPAYICRRDVRRTSQTNHLWIRYVEVSSLGPGANKFMCSNRWSKGTVYKSSLEKAGNCFVLFVLWFRMTINVTLKYFGVSAFVVNRNHRMVMDISGRLDQSRH